MDGSIAQAAANGYNNRKRTRREGVRSAITVLGAPPAAPPERQGVRRMHKQWMHAGAKGGERDNRRRGKGRRMDVDGRKGLQSMQQ